MINYTERIALLMDDVVRRTPSLSFIKLPEIVIFGRFGRADAEGAFATCHCLTLPTSEPGYFFWKDRATGEMTRQSEWFITKSPTVRVGPTQIKYLISFVLPRFCNQSLKHSRKAEHYPGAPTWVGKLDTIVHELYHIDPEHSGLRRVKCADGSDSERSHGPHFYHGCRPDGEGVSGVTSRSVARRVPGARLRPAERSLRRRGGTTFRNFPSFPQRYMERCEMPATEPLVRIEPLKRPTQPELYTEDDLHIRQFTENSTRRLTRKGQHRAA